LQTALAPALGSGLAGGLISAGIERVVWHGMLTGECYAHAVTSPDGRGLRADVRIFDPSGQPLVEATGGTVRPSAGTASPAAPPRGSADAEHSESRAAGPTLGLVRDSLLAVPDGAQRRAAVEEHTTGCVAAVARMPAAAIDPDTHLRGLGIDSLMTLELRNRLEVRFGVVLSTAAIANHATVRQLAPLVAREAGLPPR